MSALSRVVMIPVRPVFYRRGSGAGLIESTVRFIFVLSYLKQTVKLKASLGASTWGQM